MALVRRHAKVVRDLRHLRVDDAPRVEQQDDVLADRRAHHGPSDHGQRGKRGPEETQMRAGDGPWFGGRSDLEVVECFVAEALDLRARLSIRGRLGYGFGARAAQGRYRLCRTERPEPRAPRGSRAADARGQG